MNKLNLRRFKAFKDEISIDIEDKSLLVYGENGAGKSSIYEALKIIFFQDKLSNDIRISPTPEEQEQNRRDFWSKYNNKNAESDFEILINDESYNNFNRVNYQVFMFSLNEIFFEEKITYDTLLKKVYFDLNIENFWLENYSYVQIEVNEALKSFHEHIQIEIDNQDGLTIKIIDEVRNIESKIDIKRYFNEAKLSLIILLLLFESIKYAANSDNNIKKVLILDDFITSLDIANRTFLMKYIFDKFSEFQIIIFTHNVHFYNLTSFLINDIYKLNWNFANIYEFDNNNKLFLKSSVKTVDQIRSLYKSNPLDIDDIGNKIRQKFEILLYEFSKLLMIGAVEDNNKILEHVLSNKNIYIKNKKNATNLVEELSGIIEKNLNDLNNKRNVPNLAEQMSSIIEKNLNDLNTSLKAKIDEYKIENLDDIKQILNQLKMYRKVTMHPMSHGNLGQTSFQTREISVSLDLLEHFEKAIDNLKDSSVSGM